MSEQNVLPLLKKATAYFEEKGISEAKHSAEHLLAYALGQKRLQLYLRFDQPVSDEELEHFRGLVRRRLAQEPVQYIVGSTEFYGMEFEVTPDVLIPRPETEHLVEAVIDWKKAQTATGPMRLLDVGTGSGCIAIALAAQIPDLVCVASDVSEDALGVARRNAAKHGLTDRITFLQHDILNGSAALSGPFDILISNPPYVASNEITALQPEIREHEPMIALTDGGDGLAFYRALASQASLLLRAGGLFACEIGFGQATDVRQILADAGIRNITIVQDYSGIERVVMGNTYADCAD